MGGEPLGMCVCYEVAAAGSVQGAWVCCNTLAQPLFVVECTAWEVGGKGQAGQAPMRLLRRRHDGCLE